MAAIDSELIEVEFSHKGDEYVLKAKITFELIGGEEALLSASIGEYRFYKRHNGGWIPMVTDGRIDLVNSPEMQKMLDTMDSELKAEFIKGDW